MLFISQTPLRMNSNNTLAYVVGEMAAEKMIKEYNLNGVGFSGPNIKSRI